jgi:hypothetical protein
MFEMMMSVNVKSIHYMVALEQVRKTSNLAFFKRDGVTLLLRILLLFMVTSFDFITFKIAVNSNCNINGAVKIKNG